MAIRKQLIKNENRLHTRHDFLKKMGFGTTSLALSQLIPHHAIAGENRSNPPAANLYNEKYRPQFHFTPRKN